MLCRPKQQSAGKATVLIRLDSSTVDLWLLIFAHVSSAVLIAAGIDFWSCPWIGWMGLVPILMAIRFLTPVKASLCGGIWGICFYATLFVLGIEPVSRTSITIAVTLFLPVLYVCAGALLTRRIGFQPLFLAFGWIILEYGFSLAGIQHHILGNVQETGEVVRLLGDAFGYLFVAFLIALANAELLRIIFGICVRNVAGDLLKFLYCASSRLCVNVPGFNSLITTGSYRPRAPPIIISTYLW